MIVRLMADGGDQQHNVGCEVRGSNGFDSCPQKSAHIYYKLKSGHFEWQGIASFMTWKQHCDPTKDRNSILEMFTCIFQKLSLVELVTRISCYAEQIIKWGRQCSQTKVFTAAPEVDDVALKAVDASHILCTLTLKYSTFDSHNVFVCFR